MRGTLILRLVPWLRTGQGRRAGMLLGVCCLGLFASPASGQRLAVGDADAAYLRILQLLGQASLENSMMIRPLSMKAGLGASVEPRTDPWGGRWGGSFRRTGQESIYVHDPKFRTIFHSEGPDSRNEGALTPGSGFTGAWEGGASLRQGPLTVSVRPMVAWVQNGEFPLAPVEVNGQPEFAYPWRRMDAPQRFGPDAFWQFDWGQSEVRLDLGALSTSLGTTNLWWGPGIRNAILMSNNAAGFPHAALETSRPLDLGIGRIEAQWIFGRLRTSEWFDPSIEDNGRYVTGVSVAFSPDFGGLRGLSLNAARVFYANVPETGLPFGEYFLVFQTPIKNSLDTPESPTGDDERDQLFSLSARWVLPESGFEVYAEWARNDHSERSRDYFVVLGNTQGYTLGFQKAIELTTGNVLVLNGEVTQLDNPADTRAWGASPVYYSHGLVPRGYTNEGQVVGAAIGTGGTSQYIGAELYAPWGRASTFVRRRLFDKDAWEARRVGGQDLSLDAQLTTGVGATWFRGAWDLEGSVERSWRFNQFFRPLDDATSLRMSVGARWRHGWTQTR